MIDYNDGTMVKSMNKKKTVLSMAAVAMAATLMVGGTLAYFTADDVKANSLTVGKVQIRLDEPEFAEDTDNTYEMSVLPNQLIVKDPTVTVEADSVDCYIRVSIDIEGLEGMQDEDGNSYEEMLESAFLVEDEEGELQTMAEYGWVKNDSDGYYYLDTSMQANDSVPVFSQFTVPGTWGNEIKDKTFSVSIQAQAIQADGFDADQDQNGVIDSWNYSDGEEIAVEEYSITAVSE